MSEFLDEYLLLCTSHLLPARNTQIIPVLFPHLPVLVCFSLVLLVTCNALSFTWTPMLVFYTPFYRRIPLHLSVAHMKQKGEYPASVIILMVVPDMPVPSSWLSVLSQSSSLCPELDVLITFCGIAYHLTPLNQLLHSLSSHFSLLIISCDTFC